MTTIPEERRRHSPPLISRPLVTTARDVHTAARSTDDTPVVPKIAQTKIPVSRIRAGCRGALWLCLSMLLILPALVTWPRLNFDPIATSSRLVEHSWATILGALIVAGLAVLVVAVRWLALAFWLGRVGILADDDHLRFCLGPFGKHTFDWDRMEAPYRFEMSLDADAVPDVFDPDEEIRSYLPQFKHPDAPPGRLNALFRSYVSLPESQLANQLRLYVEHVRHSRDLRDAAARSRVPPQAAPANHPEQA